MAQTITIYTDGGSRGNPGPAAGAFVLLDENNKQLCAQAKFISAATNNFAEYTALVCALEKAKSIGANVLKIFSDSELMVKQIQGRYKVKNTDIKLLYLETTKLAYSFSSFNITSIPREQNREADRLANLALDKE